MPRRHYPRPTDAEVAILRVLWNRGPSTVRQVQEGLTKESGYTTVLKLMQIMNEKGLVLREAQGRTHLYRPAYSEQAVQHRLVRDLTDRVFEGSAMKLALRALSSKKASAEELAEVRRLLDELERKGER